MAEKYRWWSGKASCLTCYIFRAFPDNDSITFLATLSQWPCSCQKGNFHDIVLSPISLCCINHLTLLRQVWLCCICTTLQPAAGCSLSLASSLADWTSPAFSASFISHLRLFNSFHVSACTRSCSLSFFPVLFSSFVFFNISNIKLTLVFCITLARSFPFLLFRGRKTEKNNEMLPKCFVTKNSRTSI